MKNDWRCSWKTKKSLQTLKTDQKLKLIGDFGKKVKREIDRDYLIYKTGIMKKSKTYDFQKFKIIWSFGRDIYSVITRKYAFEEKINLIN